MFGVHDLISPRLSCSFILCSFSFHFSPLLPPFYPFFFFNDPATTEIYTLSLHDALPILHQPALGQRALGPVRCGVLLGQGRSEEHTSELQSRGHLVCRLLLEKKKNSADRRQRQTHKKAARILISKLTQRGMIGSLITTNR